jgi:hypothetical protein
MRDSNFSAGAALKSLIDGHITRQKAKNINAVVNLFPPDQHFFNQNKYDLRIFLKKNASS